MLGMWITDNRAISVRLLQHAISGHGDKLHNNIATRPIYNMDLAKHNIHKSTFVYGIGLYIVLHCIFFPSMPTCWYLISA